MKRFFGNSKQRYTTYMPSRKCVKLHRTSEDEEPKEIHAHLLKNLNLTAARILARYRATHACNPATICGPLLIAGSGPFRTLELALTRSTRPFNAGGGFEAGFCSPDSMCSLNHCGMRIVSEYVCWTRKA